MKDKQFDPARNNEKAPAEGIAAVNTHNPDEEPIEEFSEQKQEKEKYRPEKNETKNERS